MSEQLTLVPSGVLRSAHRVINPVTSSDEPVVILQSEHGFYWNNTTGWANVCATQFATFTPSVITAPDGSAYGNKITASNVTIYHSLVPQFFNGTNYRGYSGAQTGSNVCFDLYIKAGSLTQVEIRYSANFGVTDNLYRFDLVSCTQIAGPTDGKITIEPAALTSPAIPGWCRIIGTGWSIANSANTQVGFCTVFLVKNGLGYNNGSGWASDGVSDYIYNWSCKAEVNTAFPGLPEISVPSSVYFPSSNSGSDVVAIPLGSLSTPQAMTIYMEWFDRSNAVAAGLTIPLIQGGTVVNPGIVRVGDILGTANNSLNIVQTTTGFVGTINNGGTSSTSTLSAVPTYGNLVALRATLTTAGALTIYVSINGAAEVVGTTSTAVGMPGSWVEATAWPNTLGGTAFGNMVLRSFKIYPGVLSKAVIAVSP